MTLNASRFIDWLRSKVGLGYVYSSFGQVTTIDILRVAEQRYGAKMGDGYFQKGGDYTKGRCSRWLGKVAYDCSGLIKAGRKELTGVWGDYSAQGTYDYCLTKGKIGGIILPGTAVFMYQASSGRMTHVGVYIGNNEVIEARGADYGVVVTKLSSRSWTHCGTFKWIVYDLSDKNSPVDNNEPKENDSGDNSTPKVDDPLPTKPILDPVITKALNLGVINSPDYWDDVFTGKQIASGINVKRLMDKYNIELGKYIL